MIYSNGGFGGLKPIEGLESDERFEEGNETDCDLYSGSISAVCHLMFAVVLHRGEQYRSVMKGRNKA